MKREWMFGLGMARNGPSSETLAGPWETPEITISQAVIAVAGSGTRFLPATKTIPKEMLPIVNRPIVDYVVDELVASGIRDVVFVTRGGNGVLEGYFEAAPALEASLEDQGRNDLLDLTRRTHESINATFVEQSGRYGNGTPALNGGAILDGPFVYAFGDDLVSATVPFTRQLLDRYEQTGGVVLGVQEVPRADVPRYGMVETDAAGRVTQIVEKPAPGEVTSNLVSFGRFILSPGIIATLGDTPAGKGDELWLMDAIERYRRDGGAVFACPIENGRWFTTGDPKNYLAALVHYVLARDDLRDEFLALVRGL